MIDAEREELSPLRGFSNIEVVSKMDALLDFNKLFAAIDRLLTAKSG